MISVRNVLAGLGLAFTAYLAARGLSWTVPIDQPLVDVLTLGLYLVTTWLCLFWEYRPRVVGGHDPPPGSMDAAAPVQRPVPRTHEPLPAWAAVLALACAVIVPSSIAIAVGPDSRTEPFATWYLGGIGALMTIVMVRRRPWAAWAGIVALAIASSLWMGPLAALPLGLLGSIVWVAAAQLLLRQMDRAARDTAQLAQLQRAASGWQASQAVRQRERRVQVQRALAVAGPILTRTVATDGALDDAERTEARIAEGTLRDELRGPRLLDDDVRAELEAARRRGASVTVLDEGGLEGLDEESLAIIRRQLAQTLRSARSERLYIRTSPHASVAVTIVGRSGAGRGLSDEDAVDLWQEIAHPQA